MQIVYGAYSVPLLNRSVGVCVTFVVFKEARPTDRSKRGRFFNETVICLSGKKASSYRGAYMCHCLISLSVCLRLCACVQQSWFLLVARAVRGYLVSDRGKRSKDLLPRRSLRSLGLVAL